MVSLSSVILKARIPLFGMACLFQRALHAQARQDARAPLISLELEATRQQLVAGGGAGLTAKITNISDTTVYLYEQALTLDLPVELTSRGEATSGFPAFFPTEKHSGDSSIPDSLYFDNVLVLEPRSTYAAIWITRRTFPLSREVLSQFQYLLFSPGTYTIRAVCKYWTNPSLPASNYRTTTSSMQVTVMAPEFVIMLGAAIGGLVGYLIHPGARKRRQGLAGSRGLRVGHWILGLLGAVLMGPLVTILVSRLAGTQFVVSVTINDFWGAIAVGVAASYAGYGFLEKVLQDEREQRGGRMSDTPSKLAVPPRSSGKEGA